MNFISNPDFLQPIGTKNRDEYLLIPFHRCFKNTNMSVLINLAQRMREDHDIAYLFPKLLELTGAAPIEMYQYSVMFPEAHLMLQDLSKRTLSVDTAISFSEEFMKPLHIEKLHKTRLEVMINQLLRQPFIKKLYIQADTVTMEIANYIMEEVLHYIEVSGAKCELHLVEGSFLEIFQTAEDFTTVFLNTSYQLMEIVDSFGEEVLQDKVFIIMDNRYDYEVDTSIGKEPIMKHRCLDQFKKWLDKKRCAVSYMYPYPFASAPPKRSEEPSEEEEDT